MNKIVKKVTLSENIVKINLEAPAIARKRKASQFIVLLIDERAERIPLTIVDSDPERGTITIIFQVIGKTTAAMAGMKVIANLTRPYGIKTLVSLNPIMVDAMGMCGACRVSVGGKTRFTCVDGSEFDDHQVDFDLLTSRLRIYCNQESVTYEKNRCGWHGN